MTKRNVTTYDMEELVLQFCNFDKVNFYPNNLTRGDEIYIFVKGRWTPAIFIDYEENEIDKAKFVKAIPDTSNKPICNNTWAVINE